jgi:hypothetical protein
MRDRRVEESERVEIDEIRESQIRLGDGMPIRRTSLTSDDTILTWTSRGTVAVR